MAGGTLTSHKDINMQTLNSSTQPSWERLPKETSRAYRAFCIFRNLGPDRSQDKAYALDCAQRGKKTTKAPGTWSNWSIKHNWVERAQDYDDWIDETNRNEKAAAREERQLALSKFVTKNFHERIELHQDLCSLLKKLLNIPLSKVTQTKKDAAGAKIVTQLGPLNPGQLAEFVVALVRLEKEIIEGADPKELEEKRKIERVVWIKAPKKAYPPKDPDSDKPDRPGSGNVQSVSELGTTEEDSEEDKAA
jgi:DNA-directed RNA polymerase beta subunit